MHKAIHTDEVQCRNKISFKFDYTIVRKISYLYMYFSEILDREVRKVK